jgi:hypothetical protein
LLRTLFHHLNRGRFIRSGALALVLLSVGPGSTGPVSATERGLAMADGMLNMMEAMGLFGSDDSWRRMAEAWRSASGDERNPEQGNGDQGPPADRGARLDGDWKGRGGEWLLIRSPYFRLLSGRGQKVDGMLQLRGKLLSLHTARGRRPWVYEFAEDKGRLVLRDRDGNLFLYRRQPPKPVGNYYRQ